MIIGGMNMVFGGMIMTKQRDDYDYWRDELILIFESGTPELSRLIIIQSSNSPPRTQIWQYRVKNLQAAEGSARIYHYLLNLGDTPVIFTYGSALNNPGPCGAAAVIYPEGI
jgi:hypothetical protein